METEPYAALLAPENGQSLYVSFGKFKDKEVSAKIKIGLMR